MDIIGTVRQIAQKYGVPEYIWYPSLMNESGGNPNIVNSNGEYSVGLFQINRQAHPKYNDLDLTNPVINTEIAMRDFFKPAIDYVTKSLGLTQKEDIAKAVYFGVNPNTGKYYPSEYGGIRPIYTQSNITRFMNYFTNFVNEGAKDIGFVVNDDLNATGNIGDSQVTLPNLFSGVAWIESLYGYPVFEKAGRISFYMLAVFLIILVGTLLTGSTLLGDITRGAVNLVKK